MIWIKVLMPALFYSLVIIANGGTIAMYSNIVCAIDGSDLSTKAFTHAIALAGKLGARLTAITVTEPSIIIAPGAEMMMVDTTSILEELDKAKAESARGVLEDATKLASAAGINLTTQHVPDLPAAEGIISSAKAVHADLIVMGSHGRRGLGRLLLGSQAAEVLAHADVPVLIIK
ncbi:universal stress protein [Devosia riboflavina]